jgi:hypothetical protein
MGLNAWLRSHPLLYALVGVAVIVLGAARGQPIVIGIGAFVVLFGIARAFLF